VSRVASAWRQAVVRTVARAPRVSVLYSGGLDSTLVAFEAQGLTHVELVTVGVPGSHDMAAGQLGARLLGLPWKSRLIERSDVTRVLGSEHEALSGTSQMSRAVQVGLALAVETASETRVLCGQGADELFLGYAHFGGLASDAVRRRRQEDLRRLVRRDWPLSVELARRRGKDLTTPFLDPSFCRYARHLPTKQLQSGEGRKPLLREVAKLLKIPPELADRPKKAFQYGSGIERLLRTVAPAR
jgi:asparagine synthase (glutamine-hydrolysing)